MSRFRIAEVQAWVHPVQTRMPFRFGIAEMRRMPHLFLRVVLERDGVTAAGISADHLVPKWFTKNPGTSYQHDIQELQAVVANACRIARDTAVESTPFRLWWEIYHEQDRQARLRNWPPLLASLGASLVERALIDAFCRLDSRPLKTVLRDNGLGIDLDMIHPELHGRQPVEFLPESPAATTTVRHTVGLSDPCTDRDLGNGEWPNDGLPVSLEACIQTYGLSSFKIKVSDHTENNLKRLQVVIDTLERNLPGGYSFTLDGNESYRSVGDFAHFWESMLQVPALTGALDHLRFVEQPLHREVALESNVVEPFVASRRMPRMIIDESDATLDSLPRALACGYEGTTHKNCKGVFKSVANLALLKHRRRSPQNYLFSGEDLTNIGPVALLQDLCVAQNLGLTNIERNGHHYFRGLADFPRPIWNPLLHAHADLYYSLSDGCPAVRIQDGLMQSASLHRIGLGPDFDLSFHYFTPLEEWTADSLDYQKG